MILVENNSKLYYFETGRYNHNSWKFKESKSTEPVTLFLLPTPGGVNPFLRDLKIPPVKKCFAKPSRLFNSCAYSIKSLKSTFWI